MTPREFETSPLVVGAGQLWPQAIHADFLSAIGDGDLLREAFERWLVQDYLFAQGLTTFEAITVAKTPRPAQKVLIVGLAAMDAEMDWFEEMARNSNLDLSEAAHPTCRRYVDFLIASAYSLPYASEANLSRFTPLILSLPVRRTCRESLRRRAA